MEYQRVKISSDFGFLKGILLMIIFFTTGAAIWPGIESSLAFLSYASISTIILVLLYSLPVVFYDNNSLFITGWRRDEITVPLKNIQSIKYSMIGLGSQGSWLIKYMPGNRGIKSIRVFPVFLPGSFTDFIQAVKKENPALETRTWTAGINELWD